MYLENLRFGWKLWWSVLFSIMLVVGWAITPAQAHCKANGPHSTAEHCAGSGGGEDPPPPSDADPAIVYDASFKVRSTVTRSIFVVNSDGTNRLPVIEGTKELSYRDASWSPDGKGLVFRVQPTIGTDNPSLDPGIYTIRMIEENDNWTGEWSVPKFVGPVGDLDPIGVSGDLFTREHAAWHPGGSLIAYSDKRPGATPDGSANWDIVLVNADVVSDPVNLTANTLTTPESGITWSPDGSQFAVTEWHLGGSDLVVYEFGVADGLPFAANPQSLIFDEVGTPIVHVAQSNWSKSPNSNLIAVSAASDPLTGTADIWCIDLDDPGNPVNLTNTPDIHELDPIWSSNDSQMIINIGANRQLFYVDLVYDPNPDVKCPIGILNQTVIAESGKQIIHVQNPDWRR